MTQQPQTDIAVSSAQRSSEAVFFRLQDLPEAARGAGEGRDRFLLRAVGGRTVDLAIVKNQPISGKRSVQLRLEIFNLLNRANFDIPFNDPDGEAVFDDTGARIPTAGKIFATSTDAREMQIALRFVF